MSSEVVNKKNNQINLKYFNKLPNVGDVLSLEICKFYFSNDIIATSKDESTDVNIILIGSILDWADKASLVCGSGFIKKESKVKNNPKLIACVRGRLSGSILDKQGIERLDNFGDPGLLAKFLYQDKPNLKYKIGVIPHYVDKELALNNPMIQDEGITLIDVFLPPKEFCLKIQECEIILSSSLHGLIIAHSFGMPALWVEFSNAVIGNGFKFYDYYSGLDINDEKVIRCFVSPGTDLYELSEFATEVQIDNSIDMLNHSILETRKML